MQKKTFSERLERRVWRFLARFVSFRVTLSVLITILLPFIIFGALRSWRVTENRAEEWVPRSFPETQKFVRFLKVFGGDELLILSWNTCSLDSKLLPEFRDKLLEPVEYDGGARTYFREVLTGADAYDRLTGPPLNMSDDEFHSKFDSFLFSTDGELVAVIALVSDDGKKYRRQAVARVWEVADEIENLGRERIHIGGSTTDSVSIDDVCRNHIVEMNLVSYLIGVVILMFCFRNLRVASLVFAISLLNQQICMALIYYLGVTFDSILMLAVNLTFVLSLSSCIHLTNYYYNARAHLSPKLAVFKMLRDAITPVSGSVITTLLGLLSLQSGVLLPARRFSAIGAASLLILTFVVFTYISVHFLLFPLPERSVRKVQSNYPQYLVRSNIFGRRRFVYEDPEEEAQSFREKFGERAFWTFGRFPTRRPLITFVLCLIVAGVCSYKLGDIQTRVGLRQSLKSSTRQIKDYEWLEKRFGPLIPVEIMLKAPLDDDKDAFFQEFYELQDVVDALRATLPDATVISALNFTLDLPSEYERSFRATSARSSFKKLLFEHRDSLFASGYIRETEDGRYFRVTVRTYAMQDVDYSLFARQVEQAVDDAFADNVRERRMFIPEETLITGSIPVVQRVQIQLIRDLQKSFLFAFITIGIVLAIIYRSALCGLLAVFPCVFPCVFVFGIVAFLGLKIELGTMLTGSAALGVAADDIVHFIAWFRLGAANPKNSREDAVRFAFRNCAFAMFQTSAVIVLGLTAYLISDFIPTVYFSFFMGALLITAHFASYIILPAILVLPTGELFLKPIRRRERALREEEEELVARRDDDAAKKD